MTETFKILNPKGVQSAVITVTAHDITFTEDNTLITGNGVSPTGIFKAAMGYTLELVKPPLATTS